jgi:hypothetical protein
VSINANITADYKQLRFISSGKAREWMRATVDGLMIILCIVERAHLTFIKRKKKEEQLDFLQNLGAHFGELTD